MRRHAARRSTPSCVGYGISSDASHMTEPDPTGENPARAMTMALDDARRRPDRGRLRQRARDLDAARRLRRDAGDQAGVRRGACEDELAVSSTKGATGHCFGAAGAVEAVFTTLAVATGSAADDQLRGAGSGLRSRLRAERGARPARPERRGLELVRLRRAQRVDRRPSLGRRTRDSETGLWSGRTHDP